jgi:hypothetical protein
MKKPSSSRWRDVIYVIIIWREKCVLHLFLDEDGKRHNIRVSLKHIHGENDMIYDKMVQISWKHASDRRASLWFQEKHIDVTHLHQLSSTCKAGKGNRAVSPTHPLCWETSESGLPWRRRPEAPFAEAKNLRPYGEAWHRSLLNKFLHASNLTFCKPMEGQWQVDTGSDHAWAALKFSPPASTAQARMSTQFVKLCPPWKHIVRFISIHLG